MLRTLAVLAGLAASVLAAGCASPHAPQEFDFSEPVTLCWTQSNGAEACII